MLLSLHVKHMALLREEEVDFGPGLNILTGETGAGKSIIIGSVGVAIGSGHFKDYIRPDETSALVELIFESRDARVTEVLRSMDIPVEDDQIILARKYQNGRTINRINGESVSQKQLREVASYLIDIHGQHEHQSLLHTRFHRELLDTYAGEALQKALEAYGEAYREWRSLSNELRDSSLDEASRAKQIDLLSYEVREIEEAALIPGEDEQLEKEYQRMANGARILEALSQVAGLCGGDGEAADAVGRSIRLLSGVSGYDTRLEELCDELAQAEDMLGSFARSLGSYMDDFTYDGRSFEETTRRLDLINHLKTKYGRTIEDVLTYLKNNREELEKLQDYDSYLANLRARHDAAAARVGKLAAQVTGLRREAAGPLEKKIGEALRDLNFADVRFAISFEALAEPAAFGADEVCFCIAANPGMPLRPLSQVASGGELSRIMLAIKSVMAEQDSIGTLIFDEIDTGISGRTAQKVSEKMAVIAQHHQVICITHLPQIAAMADTHFEISKSVQDGETRTHIRPLGEEESVTELARILGGVKITDTVMENAREMRQQARERKGTNRKEEGK